MSTNVEILFRQLNDPVPDNWVAGLRWQVEAHPIKWDTTYPVGLAWVTVPPPDVMPPIVDMILVSDEWRRQGVATALVQAIDRRWPNVMLTEAISKAGEGLLKSLEAGSIVGGLFT